VDREEGSDRWPSGYGQDVTGKLHEIWYAGRRRDALLSEDEEVFGIFSVEITKGQRLSARFRYIKAIPGELHIDKQARLVRTEKPNVCVIVLNVESFMPPNNTDNSEMIVWFRKFCRMMVQHFSRLSDAAHEKVRLVVVLNKSDKVSASVMQQARKRISHHLEEILTQEFSNRMRNTPVLPCCLIDSPAHAKHRDAVIRRLLADLQ
jgi:hypothetical protein